VIATSTTAYIALGSNLGNRQANIETAIDRLRNTPGIQVTKVSSLLDNPAVGGPTDSPAFLNAAAEIQTTLTPRELLNRLLEIEKSLGRERREKWGSRLIDLDIVLYGNQIIAEPDLQIPHPLMHERPFVLKPLAQIAPHVLHPVLQKSVGQLASEIA
jgi:2-amino-4-hydroxy-6-hydroxymethyldihydropteridine diphosphokinase